MSMDDITITKTGDGFYRATSHECPAFAVEEVSRAELLRKVASIIAFHDATQKVELLALAAAAEAGDRTEVTGLSREDRRCILWPDQESRK